MALSKSQEELRPAYQLFQSLVSMVFRLSPNVYSIYGFPTASGIADYTKHSGESGRILDVQAIVNGKSTFLLSYSNTVEGFYKSLPIVEDIVKSILILK